MAFSLFVIFGFSLVAFIVFLLLLFFTFVVSTIIWCVEFLFWCYVVFCVLPVTLRVCPEFGDIFFYNLGEYLMHTIHLAFFLSFYAFETCMFSFHNLQSSKYSFLWLWFCFCHFFIESVISKICLQGLFLCLLWIHLPCVILYIWGYCEILLPWFLSQSICHLLYVKATNFCELIVCLAAVLKVFIKL